MEIREFCEQVLFGTRLEDKLHRPERFEDANRGAALGAISMPGRPRGLEIDFEKSRAKFPALHELDRPEAHGRALHFFANHELLAIELMAVALLRFPDAPRPFRQGLASIMREEQHHLQLYRDRARALGVEIGSYPLNGFFWTCLCDVGSLEEAVASMSLTLEQANLDYAAYYARAFRKVGAIETAEILERVLEDEVRHVAHGLHWFRQWIGGDEELFEAHAARLRLPLSIRRARGVGFELEPRRKAGLPEDYVAKVAAFRGSRGRPPVVHTFNPECEDEVRTGVETKASDIVDDLRRDLETLPLFLATPEDIVWVHRAPSPRFVSGLEAAGIACPQFTTEVPEAREHPHLGDLRPWGWSAVAQQRLGHLFDRVVGRPRFFEGEWTSASRRIHAKSFALPILRELLEGKSAASERSWLSPIEMIGRRCENAQCVAESVQDLAIRGHAECVIKGEYGNAGRHMQRVREGVLEGPQTRWVEGALARHGALVVEPWVDRVCDLSLRMHIDAPGRGRIAHIGRSLVDARGQYLGGILGNFSRALPTSLQRWATDEGRDRARITRVMNDVADRVTKALEPSAYVGPVGVDALVYRDRERELRLKPIVEVNPRTTMGHVCVALQRWVVHKRVALWAVFSARELAKSGFDSPATFAESLQGRHPLRVVDARIDGGALFTTDPFSARSFVTVLFVAESAKALTSMLDPTWNLSRVLSDVLPS